jgi:hypothetical protein
MQTNQKENAFYKRTENLTNIMFMEAEKKLLEKGLKYDLHYKHKDWIKTLAIEADTAISEIQERDQMCMRQIVANKQKTQNER